MPSTRKKNGKSKNTNNLMTRWLQCHINCFISSLYDFRLRLSPEEQDLAYQWKANMVRRLQHQNVALASELGMHATIREVRRKQKQADQSVKKYHEEKVSRVNAVKLMRMYEKRAKEGV